MLRIIAGEFRSRRLLTPADEAVSRPYANRAREALFNMLREWFEDARVLDLFAGVGTVGLEAVSRGAAEVLFVERDRKIFSLLEQNIAELGCADRARAWCGDALSEATLLRTPDPVDLAFVDPPYPMMSEERSRRRILEQMARIRRVMADRSFLILRSPLGPPEIDLTVAGLDGPEPHRYGKGMWVLLYEPKPPAGPDAAASEAGENV